MDRHVCGVDGPIATQLTGTTRRSQYRVLVLSRPVVQDDPAVCTVTRRRPREPFHHGPHVRPPSRTRCTPNAAHSVHSSTCPLLFTSLVVLGQDRFSTDACSLPHSHTPAPPPTTPRVPGGRPPRAAPLMLCLLVNPFHPFNSSFIARAPQQERPARTKGQCELDCKKRGRGEVVGEHIHRAADSERR